MPARKNAPVTPEGPIPRLGHGAGVFVLVHVTEHLLTNGGVPHIEPRQHTLVGRRIRIKRRPTSLCRVVSRMETVEESSDTQVCHEITLAYQVMHNEFQTRVPRLNGAAGSLLQRIVFVVEDFAEFDNLMQTVIRTSVHRQP